VKTNLALAFVITALLTGGQAVADKPPWAGGSGKGDRNERDANRDTDHRGDRGDREDRGEHKDRRDDSQSRHRDGDDRSAHDGRRSNDHVRQHFGDRHRTIAHDYYRDAFRRGHCPPGLARKNNGCMPPGQARRWSVGHPLPREVIYYDVPSALVVQFEQPPSGYRYVRVASDILLIALGTGMVIDAMQDLGGL